jgi:hypothetical protein
MQSFMTTRAVLDDYACNTLWQHSCAVLKVSKNVAAAAWTDSSTLRSKVGVPGRGGASAGVWRGHGCRKRGEAIPLTWWGIMGCITDWLQGLPWMPAAR